MSEFRQFLETAALRYRTKGEFAEAIGITPGRLSRILGGEHSLDVMNCLKLAKLTGDSPSRVLRVAGKGEVADLIESLYGPGQSPLSPTERELLDTWNALNERERDSFRTLLEAIGASGRKRAASTPSSRSFRQREGRHRAIK